MDFSSPSFNIIDIVALAGIALSALMGVLHGLTGELARLCGVGAGALAGYYTARLWQSLAAQWFTEEAARMQRGIVVVVAILVTVVVTSAVTWRIVKRFLRLILQQPADGILGGVFGTVRGAVVVLFLLCLGSFVLRGDAEDYVFWNSTTGRSSLPAVRWVRATIGKASLPFLGETEREQPVADEDEDGSKEYEDEPTH